MTGRNYGGSLRGRSSVDRKVEATRPRGRYGLGYFELSKIITGAHAGQVIAAGPLTQGCSFWASSAACSLSISPRRLAISVRRTCSGAMLFLPIAASCFFSASIP